MYSVHVHEATLLYCTSGSCMQLIRVHEMHGQMHLN